MAYTATYYKGDTIYVDYWNSTSNPGITLKNDSTVISYLNDDLSR